MRKRTKRRLLWAGTVVVVLALIGVGVKLGCDQWNSTYLRLHGKSVRLDSTSLDLQGQTSPDLQTIMQLDQLTSLDVTETGITLSQYLQLKEALPNCSILWSVPFQNGYVHCRTTELTIGSLTVEDIDILVHLPQLTTVNAQNCTDLGALLTLRERFPELDVVYKVPISGTEYEPDTTQLALSRTDPDEFTAALPHLQQLEAVAFTGDIPSNEQICVWKEAYPDVRFIWDFELCGKQVNSQDTELDLSNIAMESIDEVDAAMDCFYDMQKVEMCNCGIPSEQMDILVQKYPETKFVWIVKVGFIELRTDVTVFMPWQYGYAGGGFLDQYTAELKYCTDIICMDLGHMPISDLSFLKNMTNMQYLILAECTATDFSVLRNLKELKYLELFLTAFDDAQILADLPKLEDLNICYTQIKDVEPLLTMTNLKNLWMSGLYRTTWNDRQKAKEGLTNTRVEYNTYGSTEGGWRQLPNYYAQRDLLGMGYMTG